MSKKLHVDICWEQNSTTAAAEFTLTHGITALIGPSGAGKSTLARLITGLEKPDRGLIKFGNCPLYDSDKRINIRPNKRHIALMPQEANLFPHMTARQNILFMSQMADNSLEDYIQLAGIQGLMNKYPHMLSGGEAQRVSLIRALASSPEMLILDEPFTGLDPKSKSSLIHLVRSVAQTAEIPILLITHQIDEMLKTAKNAILMVDGRTHLCGPIEQVLTDPRTTRCLHLDDAGTLIHAQVISRAEGLLRLCVGSQTMYLPDEGEPVGASLQLRVLAKDVALALHPVSGVSILNQLESTIGKMAQNGSHMDISLQLNGTDEHLVSRITQKSYDALNLAEGGTAYALIKAVAVREIISAP